MARIKREFPTKASAQEMKEYVSTKLLPRPELGALLDKVNWQGDTLHVDSKLGSGTIELRDNLVVVDIELSFFGRLAQGKIESTIEQTFKQLKS